MSKLVTIYGGSGFVGRYIARRMAKEGWRVRVAVRRPNEAMHVKPYGVPGQVEPVFCNIRDDASVAAVMAGADAVVNCVGVLSEAGKNTFSAVQAEGAGRIARSAIRNRLSARGSRHTRSAVAPPSPQAPRLKAQTPPQAADNRPPHPMYARLNSPRPDRPTKPRASRFLQRTQCSHQAARGLPS